MIHIVSAFSAANQVVLGQVKTAEKSNEITANPEVLNLLNTGQDHEKPLCSKGFKGVINQANPIEANHFVQYYSLRI